MKLRTILRTGLGQDSHRFLPEGEIKPCLIGGILFEEVPGLQGNSDADVVLHALCNALSSLSGVVILGKRADELLEKQGITDSRIYVQEALASLGSQQITHVAISLEGARPRFLPRIPEMRLSVAEALRIPVECVGITATSGERLTDFGCGEGVQCLCIVTTMQEIYG